MLERYRHVVFCSDEDKDDVVVDMSTFPIPAAAEHDGEALTRRKRRMRRSTMMHTAGFIDVNSMHVVMLTRFINSITHFVGEVTGSMSEGAGGAPTATTGHAIGNRSVYRHVWPALL